VEAAAGEPISAARLGLYKLATYRVPASLASLTIAWALSGNFYTGVSVMLWQGLTHSMVFFANEMAWEWPQSVPSAPFVAVQGRGERSGAARASAAAEPATRVLMDGKMLPLPGGDWVVLANDSDDGVTGRLLARVDGSALTGLVAVHTNQHKREAIFAASTDCAGGDGLFAAIRYDTPEDGFCLYGRQLVPDPLAAANPLWATALKQLETAGIAVPASMMMAGARARTRANLLDVQYYFTPAVALTSRDRDDTGLSADPVAALQAWADLMQEPLELAVRGRPSPARQLPWPWDAPAVNAALVDQTQGPLLALAAEGALDAAELRRQMAEATAEAAVRERQRWSLWSRTAYKVATYRAASYVDSVAVSWLVTGSPGQGFAFATLNAMTRPVMAYVNEIAWARSGIGRAPATLVTRDFPAIGRNLP
jgi:uncharacterized membrane protein